MSTDTGMQVVFNARAFVNDDGQVTVTCAIDGREQPDKSGTRELSRAFALEILSKQGDEGERAAVEWLKTKGWDVEIEVQAPADKLNLMVGEKPTIKPDLPTLYRAAAGWVRTLAAERNASNKLAARSVMFMCAKADSQTIIAHPDVLDRYGFVELRALADDLDSCARFAEKKLADAAKPAEEKKPDLPALYREAVRWVQALIGAKVRVTELRETRSALAACAKADPETAEALIVWADTLHNYSDGALRAVVNDLDKCARLSETAADVASPRKLAQMVWEALGNGGNADEWSLDGARAYLRGRMPSTLIKLRTDLADRVRRYVEAAG